MSKTETMSQEPFHFQMYQAPKRTERIDKLYEYVGASKVGMCLERGKIITDVYMKNQSVPPIILRAIALKEILNKMSIYILPGSLLAGNQACKPNYAPLFPEYAVDFIEEEFINGKPYFPDERPADRIEYNRSDMPELKKMLEYWKGNTHKDRLYANLPKEAISAQDDVGAVNIVNFMHGGSGHLAPPWEWLFANGLKKIVQICDESIDKCEMWTIEGIEKKRFYTAAKMVCEAMIDYAHRYQKLAAQLAEKETNEQRKKELEELARVCGKVPENPAESFYEALQFMTFVQFGLQIEDNGQGICPGRFDQVMISFYREDKMKGKLNDETAMELIENFFVLLSTIERMRSWEDTAYFRGKPIFQNLTTGGIDPKTGNDATNELSYMIMDCIANARKVENLSGGNQQKVVLSKWLCADSEILIIDEPTRGIDVGAKVEIYELMNELVEKGMSILMISSEMPELMGVCDRIAIMHEGKITGELERSEFSEERIMAYATGQVI